jgi:hypothetical protein
LDISVGWDSSYLTQNDFNAVRTQLHNEVVDLTNVLLYMVDGSTNMKDIIASGNSNTALALLGAASNITANLNEPNLQSTPAEVSPWNIVSMIGSGLTTAAAFGTDGLVNPADIEGLNDTVDLVADLFSDAAGAGGGFTTAGTSSSTGLPSADYQLATTLGQLANSDLQSGMLAGFDATLDSITGDWGKLHEIGPLIADPTQKVFFSPNQVLQNATITLMTQASQRSLYLSLLPAFYQLHYWPQVYSESLTATNYPDMGYTSNGDSNNCTAFYTEGNAPPPPNVTTWYPSVGGITYARSWDNAGTPFFSDWSINPIDYYIHALNFQNVGASDSYANYLSSPLATLLFTSGSGDLNFSMDAFIAHSGPMDWRLDGKGSSFLDFSIMDPNSGANLTGHNDWNICSVAYMSSGVGVGVGPGGGSNPP